ncbi:MAG: PqqD family protein [bacterium]
MFSFRLSFIHIRVMMFNKKSKQPKNYLEIIPHRLREFIITEEGKVTVLVPKFENKFLVKYLVPIMKSKEIKVKLDEFGSEVWKQIDGQKNISEIGDSLTSKFGEKIQPVEERLTKFLTQLSNGNLISFEKES